ncbi:MAG: SUMF1/EgtB/PvdO family nonheme iron enzyme [Phycisphaerales bacterium]
MKTKAAMAATGVGLLSVLVGAMAPSAAGQSIPLSPTAQASGAIITHDQGIEFVTIGDPGNAPFTGNPPPGGSANGRGAVSYEYRIGRFEVTTEQWVEFFNAALDRPANDRLPHVVAPSTWGAVGAPAQNGGQRFRVPAGNEMRPVGNISWRMAAMYCNWLHNNKSTDRAAFMNGAYDVSTFGYIGNIFTDQLTHNPEARYWIPTWDEWIKAAHYDPNRYGEGEGGYWAYSITSDTQPIFGPPGAFGGLAQSNCCWDQFTHPGMNPFAILLGAYPTVQSPWGLLDASGATTEWNEEVLTGSFGVRWRRLDGTAWSTPSGGIVIDLVGNSGDDFPSFSPYDFGFRIASAVPAPGTSTLILVCCVSVLTHRRRVWLSDRLSSSPPFSARSARTPSPRSKRA